MPAESDSEDKPDIDPYWSQVTVDELQGLGNPREIYDTEMDSISNLKSVSDTDSTMSDDEDEIFTGPDACDVTTFIKSTCIRNRTNMNDSGLTNEDPMAMVVDEGEDGYSIFDAAMLVNTGGSAKGIQMELYDLGASRLASHVLLS